MPIIDSLLSFVTSTLSSVLTNLVVAAIILLIGFILGRVLGKLAKTVLSEMGINKFIYNFMGVRFSLEDILAAFITYSAYFLTIVLALNQLQVTEFVFNIIAFAIMFFVLLSIFLAFRDFFPNIFAGITISSKSMLKKGDHVKIDGIEGKVIEVGFYVTKLESNKDEIIFIPNSAVLRSKITHVKK